MLKEIYDPVEKFQNFMFYTYVLQSVKSGNFYIGYTADLKKRVQEHSQGLVRTTRLQRSWHLIYYEACLDIEDAKRREYYLKTTQGGRLLKRRIKEYLYKKKNS